MRKRVLPLVMTCLVALAACGSNGDGTDADVTVTFDGEQCTFEAPEEQPADNQGLYSHDLPADSLFSFAVGAEDEAGTTDEAIWLCGPVRT